MVLYLIAAEEETEPFIVFRQKYVNKNNISNYKFVKYDKDFINDNNPSHIKILIQKSLIKSVSLEPLDKKKVIEVCRSGTYHGELDYDGYPLFVSRYSRKTGELRHCIGTLEPGNIYENLKKYSTMHDLRFKPIDFDNEDLICEVNFLYDFKEVSYADLVIGDGIILEYKDKSATFLPHVCDSIVNCVEELYKKAGEMSNITPEIIKDTKFTNYKSFVYREC